MSFSSIGKVEILKDIFQEIIIPQAVYDELKSTQSMYGYNEVDLPFITVKEVKNIEKTTNLLTQLDLGEAETIVLSKERFIRKVRTLLRQLKFKKECEHA